MNKDAGIIDKVQRGLKFLMGEQLPKWIYPVTGVAAAAPVIGYELEKMNKKKTRQPFLGPQPIPPWMHMRGAIPGLLGSSMPGQAFHPSVLKYAQDESAMMQATTAVAAHLGEKTAAGLDEFGKTIQEAKRKGRKRRALNAIDAKPSQTKPGDGGSGARGISSGSGALGGGGGYGK